MAESLKGAVEKDSQLTTKTSDDINIFCKRLQKRALHQPGAPEGL